jgi:hypothetical protein
MQLGGKIPILPEKATSSIFKIEENANTASSGWEAHRKLCANDIATKQICNGKGCLRESAWLPH